MTQNLGDLRLFIEAASLGSLSAAGRKMGLSPAASSARLVKLEASLNTRLFERTTRRLRLTAEGAMYLAHCQQALDALDDAQAALQAGRSAVSGKLRIAATSDFGRNVLQGWLEEFNRLHPQITLALILGDAVANLLQDDLDLAIRFGVPQNSSMVARPLAFNRRVLCASPAYVAAQGMPEHPDDLHRFRCIVLFSASGMANEWRFERDGKVASFVVPAAGARETNDGAVARAWAIGGHGIAMKSIWDIGADLQAGRLQVLMPEWRTPDAPVHAFYQRTRYMAPRVRALLDFLVERFAQAGTELEALLRRHG
ncbi:LysR family transcriptional regulator [Herbaspirillum sp. LeCh32-8]|uniref:LysR family transcriptional regulator n=1 Tax=Herbaspirillum sp. LeCh32-8 TaxID=2821356 RepID=UPI001AE60A4E|nr:LysR family transcriptional regulator [Herbaspirillum sp. LeCh32-8]MBP0596935.1 LysR family transcriptional regulator [Herbaspirillum sp. LeCh32-8]